MEGLGLKVARWKKIVCKFSPYSKLEFSLERTENRAFVWFL